MKNLKQICVTILLACVTLTPAWATKYCETSTNLTINVSGQNKAFSCDLTMNYESNKYVVILANAKIEGKDFNFDNGMSGWTISNSNHTAEKRFDTRQTSVSGIYGTYKDSYGNNQYIYSWDTKTITLPGDAEWDNACGPKTMYFVNSWGWETPYVYLYKNGSSEKNADWPGQTLATAGATQISTTCTGAPVYQIEYDSKYDRVIFNDGSGNQTSDLVICENRFYNPHPNGQYDADEWYYSNNFSLVGTFNGWNAATNPFSAWTSGSTVVSTTVHLGAGSYEFKIRQGDRSGDYGNNGTITGDVNCWFMSPNEGNCHLTTTIESDYTFTYDFAANRLSVAFPETVPPCMTSASLSSAGSNSAVLDVAATDGDRPAPSTFRVSTSSTFDTYTDYGATTGRITVTSLASCTEYTLYVAAVDANGNVSTDNETASCRYKSVTFTTTASTGNLAQGQTCGGTLTGNADEQPPRAFDGDKTAAHSYTSYDQNGNPTTLWVNLGSLQEVNKVRIYWGDNYSNNYKIECSTDGSYYTTVLTFTSNPAHSNNCSNYQEHTFDAIEAQYIRIQTVSTNWVRIYEFEVYGTGECPIVQEEPMMISGAATDERAEEAVLHLTSRDNETSAANMIYHLNVRSTSRDLTNWNLTLTGEASGDYTIKGLVPGTDYTVTVYCEDEDHLLSTANVNTPEHKQRTFSFTTSNGGGNNCTKTWEWEDIADIHDPSFNEWPADKYHFVLDVEPVNDGGIYKINFRFTVTKVNPAEDLTMGNTYLHIYRDGWLQEHMGTNGDWTFDEYYEESDTNWDWDADNRVGIKCELSTGACIVGPFIINPVQMIDDYIHGTGDCGAGTFVITQKGRTPEITLPDGYNGSFDSQILYYRQFTPGQWEPLTIPFDVASVEVYDPDDNTMFTLAPNTYYLLREQVANVSGADFKESWFNTSDPKPLKKKAYNIFFPMNNGWGEFYTNKYVLFRGADGAQTVETSFVKGTAPSGDDQYTLYGNNTLSTTSLTAYFETSDGKYYQKETNRTLQPFECYVLANATTLSRMPRIAPWKDVPTDIENTWAETTFLPNAAVYNTFGQLIFTMQNTVFYDVLERCMTFPAGCYIVISELGTQKIIIP